MPGADQQEVIRRVDTVLDPYGGVGAYARKDHVSHATLDGDIEQLRASITLAAPLFLGVVAFLLNMLMMRQVETERTHIGVLKAFGYTNFAVACALREDGAEHHRGGGGARPASAAPGLAMR